MALITELILARHGEAHCNVVGGPRTCTGLTGVGRDQVACLATRLSAEHTLNRPIDALYSAPRRRVAETGQILAERLTLRAHSDSGLDGPEHGDADGRAWLDVKTAFAGPPSARPDRPYAQGAETWNRYLDRATAYLGELLDRHTGQRVLLACHSETIAAAHALLLGLPPQDRGRVGFVTDHASITRWQQHRNRFGRTQWMLAVHNDTAHLS